MQETDCRTAAFLTLLTRSEAFYNAVAAYGPTASRPLADRYLGFDDAIYVSCRFIEIVSKTSAPVSTYLADQPKMYNTPEIHVKCADDRKFDVVASVCDEFKREGYDVTDIDGARITFEDGWGLVRASNTTPVLVTRYEATSEARMNQIKELVEGKINKYI